jgi:carboxyl-terminal processing protease
LRTMRRASYQVPSGRLELAGAGAVTRRRRVGGVVFALAIGLLGTASSMAAPSLLSIPTDEDTEATVTRLTTSLLASSQFSHHPLDDQMARKLLDRYVEVLDGPRTLFLQSDVDEFSSYSDTLAEGIRAEGDARPARIIFDRYVERLAQQVAYDERLLRGRAFSFTGHDFYMCDRRRAPRPHGMADARAIWRQELRSEYLQEKLGDATRRPEQIVTTLLGRHARKLRDIKALDEHDVFGTFLDALAHVYDPHSDYLGHQEMETFSIAMSLSLVGVGASLTSKDGACTIGEVVPGSPAARSGQLKAGDRVLAVAESGGSPVEVTDMPLTRVLDLMRGPKGTTVTLTVLPSGSAAGIPKTIQLVRADINLEEQKAKARIVEVPQEGRGTMRLGMIDLKSFYSGGADGLGGAAADVATLLSDLRAVQVRGILLDLRGNSGGSLQEGIRLTGLFIKRGPVVQTRDFKDEVTVANDPDPTLTYDGPLVVLTSRYSASASEIVAGALQDYGRAVIIGDGETFGKGTIQTLMALAPIMDRMGLEYSFDPGALKLTVAQFYRPSGASTQLRGVVSDVVLPPASDVSDVSERKLDDPLPWDSVPATLYDRDGRVDGLLPTLRALSARRVAEDRAFLALGEEVHQLEVRATVGTVSLNEAERRKEIASSKARERIIEQEAHTIVTTSLARSITVRNARASELPTDVGRPRVLAATTDAPSAAPSDQGKPFTNNSVPEDDIIANESLHILGDYVRLQAPGQWLPRTVGERSSSRH